MARMGGGGGEERWCFGQSFSRCNASMIAVLEFELAQPPTAIVQRG